MCLVISALISKNSSIVKCDNSCHSKRIVREGFAKGSRLRRDRFANSPVTHRKSFAKCSLVLRKVFASASVAVRYGFGSASQNLWYDAVFSEKFPKQARTILVPVPEHSRSFIPKNRFSAKSGLFNGKRLPNFCHLLPNFGSFSSSPQFCAVPVLNRIL